MEPQHDLQIIVNFINYEGLRIIHSHQNLNRVLKTRKIYDAL